MAVYRNQISTVERINRMENFYNDVEKGLLSFPKYLASKYFYDKKGDFLFQQIMQCSEYYLTKCELQIFSEQTKDLAHSILERHQTFDIVELGAGDASKSIFLLQYLNKLGCEFTYFPIDISSNIIHTLEQKLPQQIPGLNVTGLHGEYIDMIEDANRLSQKRKIILFLGSNIGNFEEADAIMFLTSLQECLIPGDLLLIGFDLKKNPKQILAAYNDKAGITKQFNLNLLKRINHELGANFNLSEFDHYPTYNPVTGTCRSYLISLKEQEVFLGDHVIEFSAHEAIYTELSQKYSIQEIDVLANQTGFKPVQYFFDNNKWFVDAIWEKTTRSFKA